MPAYDQSYSPPAPIAVTTWRNSETSEAVANISMLLDTAADATIVPRVVADQLGVSPIPDQQYELMGFDGNRSFSRVAILDLLFYGKAFRGSYLLTEDSVGVIGRDVLNHLIFKFDGVALEWTVSK